MAGGWIAANLLFAVTGVPLLAAGAKVAWEAHVVGLLVGLVLIGPVWRLVCPDSARAEAKSSR